MSKWYFQRNGGMQILIAYGKEEFGKLSNQAAMTF